MNPDHWLAVAAKTVPQAQALSQTGQTLDFERLLQRVKVQAGAWSECLLPGEAAVVSAARRLQAALGVYTGLQLGVPVMLLNPALPLATQQSLCHAVGRCRWLAGKSAAAARALDGVPHAPGSEVRLIIATSGSSGEPKAVMLTRANIRAAVQASHRRTPLAAGDCWLGCLSPYHVGGLFILLRCLRAGARVLLHEGFDAARVWRDVNSAGVTHLSLVPPMLHQLLKVAEAHVPPASLRAVLVGGAALDAGLERRARAAGWPLSVTYGMSETSSQLATRMDSASRPGDVGRPLDGFQVKVERPDKQGQGRLKVRGAAVMAGYAAPGLAPGQGWRDGWLPTGDLGHLRADGSLCVLGRADDVFISGGEQVHPAPLEQLLASCPGVQEVLVSARPDPVWGDRLVALYTGKVLPQVVEAFCRARLSGARLPREFLPRAELPLGPSGKIDRRAVRDLLIRGR